MRPMKKKFLIAVVVLVALFLLVREWSEPAYQQELESAFGELLAGIEEAEGNLTSLAAMAPPRDALLALSAPGAAGVTRGVRERASGEP